MATEAELNVWLRNELVATLLRSRSGDLRLQYTQETIDRQGMGSVMLSVALPVAPRHRGAAVTTWAESLLPEGETRTAIEQQFRIRRGDTFALLEAIGADCAGAVSFLPEGQHPAVLTSSGGPLSRVDLDEAVRQLPAHPLGVAEDVRVSLGGLQAKLLLSKTSDGWARPTGGAPSTHIVKPDSHAHPGLVVAEAFSLALAHEAGLRASGFTLVHWAGRPALVLDRYDRTVDGDQVARLHQEDCGSALGIDPFGLYKYQSTSPESPSLEKIAQLLRTHATDTSAELERLAAAVVLRVAVGDTDGHVRNYSVMHDGATISLAPLYDVAPTVAFVSTKSLGLWVHGQQYLNAVTAAHLQRELQSWGMPERRALGLVRDTLERLAGGVDAAHRAVPETDRAIVDGIARRIERLQSA